MECTFPNLMPESWFCGAVSRCQATEQLSDGLYWLKWEGDLPGYFQALRNHLLRDESVLLSEAEPFLQKQQSIGKIATEWKRGGVAEIWVSTGGSTGLPKWVRHRVVNLQCAAEAYWRWREGSGFPDTVLALPPYHIGGLMAAWRALSAGGKCVFSDYHEWMKADFKPAQWKGWQLSLVPAQLNVLLDSTAAVELLGGMDRILVGGAAMSAKLRDRCRSEKLPIAPCYGMSETAAMVCGLQPEKFLAGVGGCGFALPGYGLHVAADDGRIGVSAASLFVGYAGEAEMTEPVFQTGDYGHMNEDGSLVVDGRIDCLINSGGRKIDPNWVEQALRELPGIEDVAVCGESDARWGEKVVAWIVAEAGLEDQQIRQKLLQHIPAWAAPKKIIRVAFLPRTTMGKVDWVELRGLPGQE